MFQYKAPCYWHFDPRQWGPLPCSPYVSPLWRRRFWERVTPSSVMWFPSQRSTWASGFWLFGFHLEYDREAYLEKFGIWHFHFSVATVESVECILCGENLSIQFCLWKQNDKWKICKSSATRCRLIFAATFLLDWLIFAATCELFIQHLNLAPSNVTPCNALCESCNGEATMINFPILQENVTFTF